MEKETELFLIETIRELQNHIKLNTQSAHTRFIENTTINDKERRFTPIFDKKAECFDLIQDKLGLMVCCFPNENRFVLYLTKVKYEIPISQEDYERLRGAIDG